MTSIFTRALPSGLLTTLLTVSLGVSQTPAQFETFAKQHLPQDGWSPSVVIFGDVDGDGDEDLVVEARKLTAEVRLYRNLGHARFGAGVRLAGAHFGGSDGEGSEDTVVWRHRTPASLHFSICPQAWSSTQCPKGVIRPKSSPSGMNCPGETMPRSGCDQRTSASAPIKR